MKPLSEIQAEMQEKFGRKDLSKGCFVLNKKFSRKREVYRADDCIVVYMPEVDNDFLYDHRCHYTDGKFEILGHPLILGDVLKAMPYGYVINNRGLCSNPFIGRDVFEWDLSTPYFNDLPESSQRKIHAILFPNS